jgi:hypothetical protein
MSEPSGSCPKIFLYVQPRLSSGSLRRAALRTVRAPMAAGRVRPEGIRRGAFG